MNWKQTFFKPKWQSNDVAIRLEAVTTEQHPELISSLLEIAANDEDKRVRCAAIKRLHQLENILKLYDSELDTEVKKLLEERIRQLAASTNESRPPLEFRMRVVEITSDRDLIEHLAGHAPEAVLRRAALAKVERQGVLGDCSISDGDAGIREFAASRITQHTTLKRVIDALRKSDKLLYSKLQERLHRELLEQADSGAVQIEAIRICSALEKLALDFEARDPKETDSLHTAWKQIAAHTSSEMNQRYQRVFDRLAAPPPVIPNPMAVSPEPIETKSADNAVEADLPAADAVLPQANQSLSRLAAAIHLYETENAENPGAASIGKMKHQLEKTWKHCTPPQAEDLDCYQIIIIFRLL